LSWRDGFAMPAVGSQILAGEEGDGPEHEVGGSEGFHGGDCATIILLLLVKSSLLGCEQLTLTQNRKVAA
jgi:hypothetical protein